jgi:Ran-interacting Mog1 protein
MEQHVIDAVVIVADIHVICNDLKACHDRSSPFWRHNYHNHSSGSLRCIVRSLLFSGKVVIPIFSDVREVPDNQEVFTYPDSSVSVIVEVLERVDPIDPYDAIRLQSMPFEKEFRAHNVG